MQCTWLCSGITGSCSKPLYIGTALIEVLRHSLPLFRYGQARRSPQFLMLSLPPCRCGQARRFLEILIQSLPLCRYGQARRRGRMLMPKVDFLQLLVVRAVVGRLASGEPSSTAGPAAAQSGAALAARNWMPCVAPATASHRGLLKCRCRRHT